NRCRGPLGEGHDLFGHRRTRRRRVSRARGPAGCAVWRHRAAGWDAGRHGVDSADSPAARRRARAFDRTVARERRHAPAQAPGARARRRCARGLRSRPPRPCGRDRPPVRRSRALARSRAGRACAAGASRRRSAGRAHRRSRDAPPGRGRARLRVWDRGGVLGPGRGLPRRRTPDRARCRGGRLVGGAAKRRRSRRAGSGALAIRRGLTVVLTRPAERSAELAGRLEALGFDVVIAPLVELEPIETGPIELSRYDWVVLTSITGARELRRRAEGRPARVAAIGRATARAGDGEVELVPAVSTQEGLLAELPRPAGRVLFAGAEDARRLLVDELDAEFVALYRTRAVRPDAPL